MPRILIVDDEEPIRALLKRLLELHGYSVGLAKDGIEAMDRLAEGRWDLMLLDRAMPRMSGLEVVSMARTCREYDRLRIFMLTHSSRGSEVDEAFARGANGYILKPFDMEQLLRKVRRALLAAGAPGH